jgi:hypothetical protein
MCLGSRPNSFTLRAAITIQNKTKIKIEIEIETNLRNYWIHKAKIKSKIETNLAFDS